MASLPVSPDPAATVMVLRPADPGFEVLVVRRPDRGDFGGLVVFPGGKVDEVDASNLARRVVASSHDDRHYRSAALRELAEETGLLATRDGLVPSPRLHGESLYRAIESDGSVIDGGALVLVSRWVTPVVSARRFDTRFYLLGAGEVPQVDLDEDELVGYAWVTPSAALGRYNDGEWPMILPTVSHLRWLERRASIDDAAYAAMGADGRTLIEPRIMQDGSLLPIHMPER